MVTDATLCPRCPREIAPLLIGLSGGTAAELAVVVRVLRLATGCRLETARISIHTASPTGCSMGHLKRAHQRSRLSAEEGAAWLELIHQHFRMRKDAERRRQDAERKRGSLLRDAHTCSKL